MGRLSHYLQGLKTSQVVVWAFFRQQYGHIQTIREYIACHQAWLLYRHAIVIVVTFEVLLPFFSRCSDSRCWQLTRYTTHAHTSKCCWAFHVNELRRKTCCLIHHSASVATIAARNGFRVDGSEATVEALKDESLKWPFLGWLSDPFKGCWSLQLGDKKVSLNHLVVAFGFGNLVCSYLCNRMLNIAWFTSTCYYDSGVKVISHSLFPMTRSTKDTPGSKHGTPKLNVWKIMLLSKGVIFQFQVSFRGSMPTDIFQYQYPTISHTLPHIKIFSSLAINWSQI